ncbi:MAG: PDZ domain-containing protein [Planctomycetota bacterium]
MRKPAAAFLLAFAFTLGVAVPGLGAEDVYLGLYLVDEEAATKGAYVEDVAPDSPAAKAGVKGGDLVTAWSGAAIANSHALIGKLAKAKTGDAVTLTILRDEWEKDVKVVLGKRGAAKATTDKPPAIDAAAFVKHLRAALRAEDKAERAALVGKLDGLGFDVPRDTALRARLLREALAPKQRAGDARFEEKRGEPLRPLLFATPAGYDSARLYPSVMALSAYGQDARWSLRVFALPGDELKDFEKESPEEFKDGKPKPTVPFTEGLVIAPELGMTGSNAESFADSRQRILDAIARANKDYGADPDRLVLCGMSMGGEISYDVAARHPDRFAGLACVAGGMTQIPTPLPNLRGLSVFIMHGTEDDSVPVDAAKENKKKLDELKVKNELHILEGEGHSWPRKPEAGEKVSRWLTTPRRDAWPKDLDLIFPAYPESKDPRRRIYWLEAPPQNKNRRATARVEDNVITLGQLQGFEKVTLHLAEPLVDLDREVVVRLGDREVFSGKLERRWDTLLEDLENDGWDTTRASPVRLEVDLRVKK